MSIGILAVAVALVLAPAFAHVFRKTGFSDVLLLMLFGILLGPVLGLVHAGDFGVLAPALASITLMFILFEGGLGLDLRVVSGALGQTALMSVLTWIPSAALAAVLMNYLTPVGWGLSLFTGAIFGATAPAVVVPLIRLLGVSGKPRAVLTLEPALTDALSIVVAMGIAAAIKTGDMNVSRLVGEMSLSFIISIAAGVALALAWSFLAGAMSRFPRSPFAPLALVMVLYGLCEYLGLKGPLASLAAGVTVANVGGRQIGGLRSGARFHMGGLDESDHRFTGVVAGLLKTFFFLYLGISIRLDGPRVALVAGVAVTAIFVVRLLVVRVFASRDISTRDAAVMVAMVPKGIAAATLALVPLQYGLSGAEWVSGVVFSAVFLSIVMTSLMVAAIETKPGGAACRKVFRGFAPPPPSA